MNQSIRFWSSLGGLGRLLEMKFLLRAELVWSWTTGLAEAVQSFGVQNFYSKLETNTKTEIEVVPSWTGSPRWTLSEDTTPPTGIYLYCTLFVSLLRFSFSFNPFI